MDAAGSRSGAVGAARRAARVRSAPGRDHPEVPLYGVAANLLAAPAAPLATVAGLAACLAAPLPWIQSGLTAIAWLPAAWIAGTADTFSALPGHQLAWWEGWPGVAALAVASVAIGTRRRRAAAPGGADIGGTRILSVVVVAIVAGVVGGGAALSSDRGSLDAAVGVERDRVRRRPGRRRADPLRRRRRADRHRPRTGSPRPLPRPRGRRPHRPAGAHPFRSRPRRRAGCRRRAGRHRHSTVRSRRPTMRDCCRATRGRGARTIAVPTRA